MNSLYSSLDKNPSWELEGGQFKQTEYQEQPEILLGNAADPHLNKG